MKPLYCTKGHENPNGNRFCQQCGEKLTPPVPQGVSPGLILGDRYRIVHELGHGGFGRTYLAEDRHRFNESCVLKEFAPQVQGTYALQKAAELFEREAGVLYKLQHPQIPKFRELFRIRQGDTGLIFLVQDYVDGQTYRALLDARRLQGQLFNEAEVMQLLRQILPVLEYIHSLGVIHRDISPDNLMLRSTDGLPVLIDFGGVKHVAATVASHFMASPTAGGMSAIATRLGKVGYAPQEQMQGGIVSPHSDFYALAATALVLLTGKEPSQLIDHHTLEWNWRREVNLSPVLGSVLDKMLQHRPSDRFGHAREVLQALIPPPPPAPVAYPPTQPPPSKTEVTVAVAPPHAHAPAPVNPPPTPVVKTQSPSYPENQSSGLLGKILLVFFLIAAAGAVGWLAGKWWINSQIDSEKIEAQPTNSPSGVSPTDEPQPELTPEVSEQERRRKEALQQRRTALNIRYKFYADLVNEAFWTQYPEQRGRTLSAEPEDAQAREQWDAIATDLLRQLEQAKLSVASRRQLGNFGEADLTRAKAEANQLHLSSRSLYDLADAKFFKSFPNEQGKEFLNKPIGQVWYATVAETLNLVKSGNVLEQIVFEPGTDKKQVSGTLQAGEGKALNAKFSAGQVMEVRLETAEKVSFSVYSPSGKTTLLEDSRDRSWSGELPESGFYEFVVVSNASGPINYQLDVTVKDLASPESSTDESGEE